MRAYMQYPSAPDQLLRSSVKRVTSVPLHLSAIPAITGKKDKLNSYSVLPAEGWYLRLLCPSAYIKVWNLNLYA